jgi:hypothetical protein
VGDAIVIAINARSMMIGSEQIKLNRSSFGLTSGGHSDGRHCYSSRDWKIKMRKTLLNTLAITAIALAGSTGAAKAEQPTPTPAQNKSMDNRLSVDFDAAKAPTPTPTPTPKQYIQGGPPAFATNRAVRSKDDKPTPTPTPTQKKSAINTSRSNIKHPSEAKPTPTPTPNKQH